MRHDQLNGEIVAVAERVSEVNTNHSTKFSFVKNFKRYQTF